MPARDWRAGRWSGVAVLALASCAVDRQHTAVARLRSAVNAGDARAYAAVYAEDARIEIHGSASLLGRAAIERHEVELLRQFPGATLAFHTVWQRGEQAVAHYAVNGRTPAGQAMGHEGLLFLRFDRAGRIASEHRYLDSLTPMAQLGALGERPTRPPPVLPGETSTRSAGEASEERANEALVRASLSAWAAGDRLGFLASVAEDVVVDELFLPQPFAGKEQAEAWFYAWSGAVEGLRLVVDGVLAVGDSVLVESRIGGTLVGALGPVPGSGHEFSAHRAWIFEVRAGRLVRIACFMNGRELAAGAGQRLPDQ